MKELEKLKTNMSKVYKVSGVYIPKNGHKGCIQSHILALNMIKLNKWKRVLILEDDAELVIEPEKINDIINKSLEELDLKHPEWNVIMLATANKILDDKKVTNIPLDIDNINLQKLKMATTASAYIVKDSYVDSILDLFDTCNNNMEHHKLTDNNFEIWALDQKWSELQIKDNWFCYNKDLVQQRNIWSTTMSESHT
jgi:GR25 family glycosyltransferase involved in LPS biosynthesis